MHRLRIGSGHHVLSDNAQLSRFRPLVRYLFSAALALLSLCCSADDRPLRFSVTESGVMPLVDIRDGKAVSGILHDLPIRLAQRLGRQAVLVVLPRMRVQRALLQNEVDAHCYANAIWLPDDYPGYVWSTPYMVQRDLLVARHARPEHPNNLSYQSIGTVLGYDYPTLQAQFASGTLRRDDGRTQGLVLTKLAAGRYDYAISNELALRWYNRQHRPAEPLHQVHELTRNDVSCMIRDQPDVPTRQLLRAMEQMKQEGEFEAILQRYR